MIGFADRWIEHTTVQGERRGGGIKPCTPVQLEGGPRQETLLSEELRKAGGVTRNAKGFLGGPPRRLMLAVSIPGGAAEDRHDDLGPKPADNPHYIFEDGVTRPVLPCLVQRLGKAEVVGSSEVLPGPIQPTGRQ